MKFLFPCFTLGLFLLYAPGAMSQRFPMEVSLPSNATMPFQLGSDFLIVVEGKIGPLTSLRFILDTGETRTTVDARIADKLLLPRHKGKVLNFDKNIKVDWTNVPELRLGPLTARNFPAMVGNLKQFSEFAESVDAIIGLDLLSAAEGILIDYRGRLVTLKASIGTLAKSISTAITIRIPVQDQLARLIVDTGLQDILLYEDRVRRHLPQLKLNGAIMRAYAGRLRGQAATLTGIRLGADESQSSVLLLPVAPASFPEDIDGYIGTNVLHAQMVDLNFVSKELRWQ
jgi:hypothetical protein